MPKFTNTENLPLPIVAAVINDDYSPGDSDITVTTLLRPPQQVYLTRKHDEEIEEDVSDRIWSLLGQVIHSILERGDLSTIPAELLPAADAITNGEYQAEERVYADFNGTKVGGKYDLYYRDAEFGWVLQDWKFVSVWEVINGPKEERHQQLNMLAEIMRRQGRPVDRLEVVVIIRDWAKSKARREPETYPQRQVMRYFIPLWSPARTTAFIEERVALHMDHGGSPEPCSEEDRWAGKTTYRVLKEGRKTAMRVLDSYDAAWQWAESKGHVAEGRFGDVVETTLKKGISIVERKGEQKRCLDYCSALPFCAQGLALVAAGSGDGDDDE